MPDRDNTVRLEGNDYHYLVRVRRFAAGEYFPALLSTGEETLIQVVSIDHNVLIGKCSSLLCEKSLLIPPIILFQALPKADKMDMIVRQAAEGGITEIVPFVSEFSVAKTNASGEKFTRWQRIIKEARQQSGSKIMTSLHCPLTRDELFDYWKKINNTGALGLLFHHLSDQGGGLEQKSLHSYLNNIPPDVSTASGLQCKPVVVFAVGPEGGFSNTEVSLFLGNSFKPFTIGDTILRSETAALYCAAAIKILLLERNSWELKIAKNCSA